MCRSISSLAVRLARSRASIVAARIPTRVAVAPRFTHGVLASRALRSFSTSSAVFMFAAGAGAENKAPSPASFFDLQAKDKRHKEVNMSDYTGKVILVVNVASKCGFTSQYKELEELYQKYKDRGLVIIGFPCNQFGKQSTFLTSVHSATCTTEIESFCQVNYGVSFPLMDKIDVNGSQEDPVYTFLKSQKAGLLGLTRIKWNFEKFLVSKDGVVYGRYSSATNPSSLAEDIERLLDHA
ncbi:Glutathione peroxidase 2 [Gamsiella multidivaricata]|nr:Glutathione peroxidase 2 [Gamsiella multidivaricata]